MNHHEKKLSHKQIRLTLIMTGIKMPQLELKRDYENVLLDKNE